MAKLTEERFSFHTLELTKSITFNEYKSIRDKIYKLAKAKTFCFYPENNCLISEQFKYIGTIIKLYDNTPNLPHIELRVNPRLLCGQYDYIGIFKCTSENIQTVQNKIDSILSIIGSPYQFGDMTLSRIDLCVNVEFDTSKISHAYMRCIRKCMVPYPFKRNKFSSDENDYKRKNKKSFRASSAEAVITIYDKAFQLREENLLPAKQTSPSALIRFEVSLKRTAIQKACKSFNSSQMDNSALLTAFALTSKLIIEKYICHFFPSGDYVKYCSAYKTIVQSGFKEKIKRRMLFLVKSTSRRNDLNSAVGMLKYEFALTDYQVNAVLNAFEKLQINPVTLKNKCRYEKIDGIRRILGLPNA